MYVCVVENVKAEPLHRSQTEPPPRESQAVRVVVDHRANIFKLGARQKRTWAERFGRPLSRFNRQATGPFPSAIPRHQVRCANAGRVMGEGERELTETNCKKSDFYLEYRYVLLTLKAMKLLCRDVWLKVRQQIVVSVGIGQRSTVKERPNRHFSKSITFLVK